MSRLEYRRTNDSPSTRMNPAITTTSGRAASIASASS